MSKTSNKDSDDMKEKLEKQKDGGSIFNNGEHNQGAVYYKASQNNEGELVSEQ